MAIFTLQTGYPALAEDAATDKRPFQETWAGGEVTSFSASVYAGYLYAFNGDVAADGLRLRLGSGYWGYWGKSTRWSNNVVIPVKLRGTSTFADIMLGYQTQWDRLTVKVYAGAEFDQQSWNRSDVNPDRQGGFVGGKLALETWLNLTPDLFAQFDANWASAHNTHYSRLRVGYAVLPSFFVGPESGFGGTLDVQEGRIGMFARYAWGGGEVSVSGGAIREADGAYAPYGTANLLLRF